MLKTSIKAMSVGAALALAAGGAFAQTTPSGSSTSGTSQTPATVGVTPQDASKANQNAVPRSDTGTVVRTDQSAADRARDAANQAQNRTGTGTSNTTTGTTGSSGMSGTSGTSGSAGMSGSTSGSMGSSSSNMDTNTNNTMGATSSDMNSNGQRMGSNGTRRARADRN